MKKSVSHTESSVRLEIPHTNNLSTSSQPVTSLLDVSRKNEFERDELCVRRSSLLSIPSSFSDTGTQQETPISMPIRATSTALQSRRIQSILPHNETIVAHISPLPPQMGPIVDPTDSFSVSTIVDGLDDTILMYKSKTCPSSSESTIDREDEKCSQISEKSEFHLEYSSTDSYRSTCDTTINLHESLENDTCSPLEEFLTEPFWSESQVDRLLND